MAVSMRTVLQALSRTVGCRTEGLCSSFFQDSWKQVIIAFSDHETTKKPHSGRGASCRAAIHLSVPAVGAFSAKPRLSTLPTPCVSCLADEFEHERVGQF